MGVTIHPYRTVPSQLELDKTEIVEMLSKNFIKPEKSEWSFPLVFVPKKDGSLHFCVDQCRLNDIAVREAY